MVKLHLSGDEKSDLLISEDPLALLIGMVLDQQITIEQAFRGPAELVSRLGIDIPIDAQLIATMDPATLTEAFSRRPSIHRYPSSMATRVQELCRIVAVDYRGDASRIWSGAHDGAELLRRVQALPGFGARKARIFVALCGKQLGVRPPGWEEASEPFGGRDTFLSVADIVDTTTLDEVRRRKRELKAAAKAAPPASQKAAGAEKSTTTSSAGKVRKVRASRSSR